jgi:hypothetical protein
MQRIIAILLLGWFAAAPSFGAPPSGASANYDIEVLVFETRLPEFEGAELWTRTGKPTDSGAITMESAQPSGDFTTTMNAMRTDGRYRVLLHKRWTQPAESKSTGPAVQLLTAENDLTGTLKFYLARFLHVELNMLYQPQVGAIGATENSAAAAGYLINEQRRVKSNELNYFDHPKFGVLVRVSPAAG